jgi:CARDB
MRRLLLAGAIIFSAGSAVSSTPALGADQHTSLKDFACHPAVKPARRAVTVTAMMRPVPGTVRLMMRFQLLSAKSGQVTAVHGGDLGTWISPSSPTLGQRSGDVWILKHPVTGVPVGSTYHFNVAFRWIGAGGRTIATSTRSTATCWQPYVRPDLFVQSISVGPAPSDPNQSQYVVWIGNGGLTAAGSFKVAFAPGGNTPGAQSVTVPRLGSRQSVSETFTGPACTAATAPTVIVDPTQQVSDANHTNNSMAATCPSSGAPGPASSPGSAATGSS